MEEPAFPNKSRRPKDSDLAELLGKSKRHWDDLANHAMEADPAARPEWGFHSAKSGWTFRVKGRRRNLVYLAPRRKHFMVAFAFGEKAVKAAAQAGLPEQVMTLIREAPKYPEGRGIRLEVRTAADVKVAKKLLAIKIQN